MPYRATSILPADDIDTERSADHKLTDSMAKGLTAISQTSKRYRLYRLAYSNVSSQYALFQVYDQDEKTMLNSCGGERQYATATTTVDPVK